MPEVFADAVLVDGLSKRYGDVVALDSVDLAIAEGTVVGLLGANGAGKTTLVRILATLTRPDAGRAAVFGRDVIRDGALVRRLIGLVGQYPAVEERLTGRENLALVGRLTHQPRRRSRRRGQELLDRFELGDAADRAVRTYSGGMRRRLDLAAALMHEPPLLVLDEPTTGLDPRSRLALWNSVRTLVDAGTTVLLTTQYLEEADRLSDRIVVMDRGRVVAKGTPAELKNRCGSGVVAVTFASPRDLSRAAGLLTRCGAVDAMDTVGLDVRLDGTATALDVVRILDTTGIEPNSLQTRAITLDDVFLALTDNSPTGVRR